LGTLLKYKKALAGSVRAFFESPIDKNLQGFENLGGLNDHDSKA